MGILSLGNRYAFCMKKSEFKSGFMWLSALFLSWLGLAGLADNLVEWREWFDVGIMEHWRTVKLWLTETVLFWIPFSVPSWAVDYFVLGCIFMRPYIFHTTQKSEDRAQEEMIKKRFEEIRGGKKVTSYSVQHQSGVPVLWIIASLLFWPVVLLDEIKDFLSNRTLGFESPQSVTIFKVVLTSIVSFVPILFVATDLIETFGL